MARAKYSECDSREVGAAFRDLCMAEVLIDRSSAPLARARRRGPGAGRCVGRDAGMIVAGIAKRLRESFLIDTPFSSATVFSLRVLDLRLCRFAAGEGLPSARRRGGWWSIKGLIVTTCQVL